MAEVIVEVSSGHEEEAIPRSPPSVAASPDSPQYVLDRPVEETDHSEGRPGNPLDQGLNILPTSATTNVLTITTPNFTVPNSLEEGPSGPPQSLPQDFQEPGNSMFNHSQSRHPRPTARYRRVPRVLNTIPRTLEGWRIDEGLLNSSRFRRATGPTNIPELTREPLHDTVPTLVLRMIRAERRSEELRDRTNILRRKVDEQDSLIVNLESEMEESQFRIHGLEETVLELQEKIARFETMFDAISRATTITPPSPS